MANLKQQKKRNRRTVKQTDRNIRYRSSIKTLFKRVQAAVDAGEAEAAAAGARQLEQLIDRAAARNVLHRNNAARKKARLARILQPGVPAA